LASFLCKEKEGSEVKRERVRRVFNSSPDRFWKNVLAKEAEKRREATRTYKNKSAS